eukprot:5372213-Amphidinium_carterae.2
MPVSGVGERDIGRMTVGFRQQQMEPHCPLFPNQRRKERHQTEKGKERANSMSHAQELSETQTPQVSGLLCVFTYERSHSPQGSGKAKMTRSPNRKHAAQLQSQEHPTKMLIILIINTPSKLNTLEKDDGLTPKRMARPRRRSRSPSVSWMVEYSGTLILFN